MPAQLCYEFQRMKRTADVVLDDLEQPLAATSGAARDHRAEAQTPEQPQLEDAQALGARAAGVEQIEKRREPVEDAELDLPGRAQLRDQLRDVGGVRHPRDVGAEAGMA